jgi:hypothetical protein
MGTATAGYGGCLSILHWNGNDYYRKIALVDGKTIKPSTKYRINNKAEFEEVVS